MDSWIDKTVSHFRIDERIGTGGMAEIYRGVDLRLERPVALKFLPPQLSLDSEARRRLLAEARAASRLDHRNICTIYEVGEAENGTPFIAMACYEGETLSSMIARSPLPPRQAADIAAQVARGLDEAHRRGIVHRDIKPSNIMLTTGGEVKILDFGIAKPISDLRRNDGSVVLGTLGYMSPERLRGFAADARSDLWSLGVVLYKMVTGTLPWSDTGGERLQESILAAEPRRLPVTSADLGVLDRILQRALARDPVQRYQGAQQMQRDLEGPFDHEPTVPVVRRRTGATAAHPDGAIDDRPSLAVLPLADLSAEQDQEYLCSGITEELIFLLAGVSGLRVVSRESAFHSGRDDDVRQAGLRLGVGHVLQGSVRKAGARLRVTVRLQRLADGTCLWSEKYDRELEDLLELQEEIAGKITAALELTLMAAPAPKLSGEIRFAAYNLYLKGRFHWNRRNEDDLTTAIGYFEQAIEEEPLFARAYAGIADSHAMLAIYGASPPTETMPRAERAAERALELDERLAEVYTSRACIRSAYHWDFTGAEEDFQHALRLDPNYPTAHQWYANNCLIPRARFGEAFDQLRHAQELDPLSLPILVSFGLCLYFAERLEEAEAKFREALAIDDSFVRVHVFLGWTLRERGRPEGALAEMRRAFELSDDRPVVISALGHACALQGDERPARQLLDKLLKTAQQRFVSPTLMAQIHVALGEIETALTALELARRRRATDLIWLGVDPVFDPLRGEPRFHALLEEMGLGEAG